MGRSLPASKDISEQQVAIDSYHHILSGVLFPTPENLLAPPRYPCQKMCSIYEANTVLKYVCKIIEHVIFYIKNYS
jgi:hypothetical protein